MQPRNSQGAAMPERIAERTYDNAALAGLIQMIDPDHRRILDVGTGVGANMAALRERGHVVTGLTISMPEAHRCHEAGLPVAVADARHPPIADSSVDGIVMCHVLEHLIDPADVLVAVRSLLVQAGAIYVALPNVLYYKQRWEFMRGRFRYVESGIMDRTHLRFFDIESARSLLEQAGYRVVGQDVAGGVPSLGMRDRAQGLWRRLDEFGLRRFPGLFGFHLIFKAVPA